MSSFIGQLRISLGLDSAAFETGAKRAAAEVNTLGSKAEAAGFKVGQMGKALIIGASAFAGAAIVSQLKEAVSAGLDYASSLGETAQQLGVTTKTLQEYRYAADQAGIAQDEIDTGLAKLTRTIGLAVEGNKKQVASFEKLGISVRDANGQVKDAGDIIPELADALQKVASPAERAAILVDLFGKSGMKMGSLLVDGAKGVNEYRDSAQKLGIVISDDLINKADAAADKMASLNKIITAKIAVAVAENADAILKLAEAFGVLIDKIGQAVNVLARFLDAWNKAKPGLKDGLFAGSSPKEVKSFLESFGLVTPGSGGGAPAPKPTNTPSSGGALLRLPNSAGSFKPGQGPLTGLAGGALLGSNIGNIAAQAPGLRTPLFENALYQSEAIQNELIKVNKAVNDTAEETNKSTVTIAKSFADMADDTVNALQNMSNSIRSGDFLSILGSAVKLVTQLGKIGVFGKATATRLNSIPGFANGTSFAPGGLALVGERGPELVSLPRGSKVFPNGTGPGGNVINNYYTLPSDEFWGRINAGHAVAAQAGGDIGFNKVQRFGSRSLAR